MYTWDELADQAWLSQRKLTMRLFSVRPWSMPGSFFE